MRQASRIMARNNADQSLSPESRARRNEAVRSTAFRYYDNIRRSDKNWNYRDASFDKQYPRSTYMGLNNG
jgi:hypothetical protein